MLNPVTHCFTGFCLSKNQLGLCFGFNHNSSIKQISLKIFNPRSVLVEKINIVDFDGAYLTQRLSVGGPCIHCTSLNL